MKNKEKYAEQIVEIVCGCCNFGVNKYTGRPVSCKYLYCSKCLLNEMNSRNCHGSRREWAEAEYVERPVISKRDREFLDYLGKELKYIVRNKSDNLIVYQNSAGKYEDEWMIDSGAIKSLQKLNIDFPMVNSEPWLIEDLKKLGVVEEYGTD